VIAAMAAHLSAPAAAAATARLQRLLMRWPCSIRIKLELREACKREAQAQAREARRCAKARAEIIGEVRTALKAADFTEIKALATRIQEALRG